MTDLFRTARTTRHCWCKAFCTSRARFAAGWFGGGNQRSFAAKLEADSAPMGLLAVDGELAIGWSACGPRRRYATSPDYRTLYGTDPEALAAEDAWLLPCVFVRDGHRGLGVSHFLITEALRMSRSAGASAIEAWPLAGGRGTTADGFVGREEVFAELGFGPVSRPVPDRVIMRHGF